jgi:hypothetical protein
VGQVGSVKEVFNIGLLCRLQPIGGRRWPLCCSKLPEPQLWAS